MCDQCGKNLATKFSLQRHRLSHQPPSLPCIVCDKVFREEWARKRHMLTHTADGACVCPTCGDVFSTKFSLTRHENQVYKSIKDYKCELRNNEDQMASSISQGFALCNLRQNYEEPFYVLGSLLSFFEQICLSATINKLNYFKFESACDCINNWSTWYSVSQIARLPY